LNLVTGVLKLAIDAQMVAPERARADDCNPQWI
jgi:hypothetical protein